VHVSPAAAAKDAETPRSASIRSARVARGEGDIVEGRGARMGRARVEICPRVERFSHVERKTHAFNTVSSDCSRIRFREAIAPKQLFGASA